MRYFKILAVMVFAFGFTLISVDTANAQTRNRKAVREYRKDIRNARKDYRKDIRRGESVREARRDYRQDVRSARRDYRKDTNQRYYRNGRWYYRTTNPRVNRTTNGYYYYRNGRRYFRRY